MRDRDEPLARSPPSVAPPRSPPGFSPDREADGRRPALFGSRYYNCCEIGWRALMPHLSRSTKEAVMTGLLWFGGIVIPILSFCTLHIFGRRRQGNRSRSSSIPLISSRSKASH